MSFVIVATVVVSGRVCGRWAVKEDTKPGATANNMGHGMARDPSGG